MNYLMELKNVIDNHTNSIPPKGFEIAYLEKSEKLLDLYSEAIMIGEKEEGAEYEKRMKQIYEKALRVVMWINLKY